MAKYEKLLRNYDEHAKRIKRSTQVNTFETPQEKRKRINLLEANYGDWFEYHFPVYAKSSCAKFHIALANLIIKNQVLYVIVNWFRGAAKSVHVCMGIPLFLMVKDELKFMLLVGQNEKKAKLLLSDIQIQLKFNQRFIYDYGDMFQFGDWGEGNFTTKTDVHFMALGVGQSPRGSRFGSERPDYIVCDDLDTPEVCNNPSRVSRYVDWIMEDLWGCFDEGRERFVLANNRISKKSILQGLLDEFKNSIEKTKKAGFKVIHKYNRVIAHDKDFNPTWGEKYTEEYWRKKYASRPHRSYNKEYLDNPIEEGKVFKRDNIQYKNILSLKKYDALGIYGDLSYKDQGDFKALKFWGKIGREYHLIDCYVRQGSRREAAIWLYNLFEDLNNKDNHLNIDVVIEGLFAQDEFVNDFDEEGDTRGWLIYVKADKRPKGNKYDRIESTCGRYERKYIFYNKKKEHNTDFQEAISQLLGFEKGSNVPDDSPDADHGCFDLLDRKSFVEKFEPRITGRRVVNGW